MEGSKTEQESREESSGQSIKQQETDIPAQSYYAVLNLTPTTATPDHIKNAYKKLCLLYHPDKFTTQQEKDLAERNFRLLNTAYRVLSDETTR